MSEVAGLKVLIIEDEALIAMMAEDMLENLGCSVSAVASCFDDALAAVDGTSFDVAMLDVNLNGDNSMPVAAVLKSRNLPFVFTTGYGSDGVSAEHLDVPVLTKPYSMTDLEGALGRCAHRPGVA